MLSSPWRDLAEGHPERFEEAGRQRVLIGMAGERHCWRGIRAPACGPRLEGIVLEQGAARVVTGETGPMAERRKGGGARGRGGQGGEGAGQQVGVLRRVLAHLERWLVRGLTPTNPEEQLARLMLLGQALTLVSIGRVEGEDEQERAQSLLEKVVASLQGLGRSHDAETKVTFPALAAVVAVLLQELPWTFRGGLGTGGQTGVDSVAVLVEGKGGIRYANVDADRPQALWTLIPTPSNYDLRREKCKADPHMPITVRPNGL